MNKKILRKYLGAVCAADFCERSGVRTVLIVPYKIGTLSGDMEFYWALGHSRWKATLVLGTAPLEPGQIRIKEIYGPYDDADLDVIEKKYIQRYFPVAPDEHPQPTVLNRYHGWVSPEGDYYNVSEENHTGVAKAICITLHDTLYTYARNAQEALLEAGWLLVRQEPNYAYLILGDDHYITNAQVDKVKVLNDLTNGFFQNQLNLQIHLRDDQSTID